ILPLLRADFAVCEMYDYLPEPPLDCSISAFGGVEDSYLAYEDLAAWREQTSAPFTLRVFPGGHFFLRSSEEQLLQALREDIARIVESHHL
ncbi:MAG TPA: thioesterase domain-containing protein, partial [Ktedonobacteraceae bacterium]